MLPHAHWAEAYFESEVRNGPKREQKLTRRALVVSLCDSTGLVLSNAWFVPATWLGGHQGHYFLYHVSDLKAQCGIAGYLALIQIFASSCCIRLVSSAFVMCSSPRRNFDPSEPFEQLCRRVEGIVLESRHPYPKVTKRAKLPFIVEFVEAVDRIPSGSRYLSESRGIFKHFVMRALYGRSCSDSLRAFVHVDEVHEPGAPCATLYWPNFVEPINGCVKRLDSTFCN